MASPHGRAPSDSCDLRDDQGLNHKEQRSPACTSHSVTTIPGVQTDLGNDVRAGFFDSRTATYRGYASSTDAITSHEALTSGICEGPDSCARRRDRISVPESG